LCPAAALPLFGLFVVSSMRSSLLAFLALSVSYFAA
jgi:hypothetical protein